MFNADQYRNMYDRFLGPLSQSVTLKVNNGTGFDSYTCTAHVSKSNERDLVAGGSIELGDLRLIILNGDLPAGMRDLEKKDRIEIDDRVYAVTHWDNYTRKIGENAVAIEVAVRG